MKKSPEIAVDLCVRVALCGIWGLLLGCFLPENGWLGVNMMKDSLIISLFIGKYEIIEDNFLKF